MGNRQAYYEKNYLISTDVIIYLDYAHIIKEIYEHSMDIM